MDKSGTINDQTEDLNTVAGFYKELFELTPTPAAIFNMEGNSLLLNRAFLSQLGYEKAKPLHEGIQFKNLFEKGENADKFLLELEKRGVIRRWEVMVKDEQGKILPVLISGRTLMYENEQVFEVSFTDISRQKRLQRVIRREHARMTSLVESISEGIFLVDRKEMISELNFSLLNLLDVDEESLINKPYQKLFANLLDSALEPEVVQQALSNAVLRVTERPVVELVLSQKSMRRHLEIDLFPVWEEEGVPIGWGGLVRDITERKEQMAWKLDMLSILSHDIRTPLATLKGHATALLANYQHWGHEMVTDFLEAIDRGIDQLVHQVDRNLALTRVETGQLGLRPQSVKPLDLARHAVERAVGTLGDKAVDIDIQDSLPDIRADPARVEEVLVNLLENAARYTSPGDVITIRATAEENWLRFSVIDRGPGVPEEKRQLIFEKYTQAESEGGGTGLGLYISRKIIEAHGGRIWVQTPDNEADSGAEFVFTLPLMPRRPREITTGERLSRERPEAPADGERILVVEDEADYQALLRSILSREGYNVEIAPDGPTALELVKTSSPDLVLLDWVLPGMDGLNVCRNLRRMYSVPIMIVTSKTAQEDLIAALDAGADDYVTKPFHGDELLARIRALLRRSVSRAIQSEADHFQTDGLVINFNSQEVWLDDDRLDLTPTEYDLFAYMARHPRITLSHEQLIDHLWGLQGEGTRRGLFVHISRLRQKIEDDPKNPRYIVTRWGLGYAFMPE